MTDERWIVKDLEQNSRGLFKALSQHFPGDTEENVEKLDIEGIGRGFIEVTTAGFPPCGCG
jgi:hypothetical protein